MPSVNLQDLNAIIHGTSKHGLEYDIAHVSMLLQTDEPIPPDTEWAIPHIEDIPEEAVTLFKSGKVPIYPMLRTKLRQSVDNIGKDIDANNKIAVLTEIENALILTSMHVTPIDSLENVSNRYIVSYKYRLYPVSPNNFEFKVLMPFDGLGLNAGGKLQVTLVSPIGASINPTLTKATDVNGQTVNAEESISPINFVNKQIVSFEIQKDPIFTIRYNY